MSHVLLINPPGPAGKTANREGSAGLGVIGPHAEIIFTIRRKPSPPWWPCCARPGYSVTCVDAVAEKLDVAATWCVCFPRATDLQIGVLMSQATLTADVDFCQHLLADTDVDVVAFGSAMRFIGQAVMEQCRVTAVALGAPETAVPRTLQALATASADDESDGEWVAGPVLPRADLTTLPRPAWELLPHYCYPFLTLRAGSGGDDDCAYCPYVAVEGHGRQVRPVQAVVDELAGPAADLSQSTLPLS